MKKLLIRLLTWIFPLAIIGYLIYAALRNDSFARLVDAPKQWGLLALATATVFAAVLLTFVRWCYLVRALDVPLTMRDAMRLGFLGYLLNFISPGSVGGDLFKAVFLGRDRPGRRTYVAVSVIVDRLLGLYAVFLLACGAILISGVWRTADSVEIQVAFQVVYWGTGVGTAILIIGALPGFSQGPIARWLHDLPRVGRFIEKLNQANRMYNRRPSVVLLALLMSVAVQAMFAISVWLIGRGLLGGVPSLGAHLVIVPLAMATGAIPLTPNGLGTFEATVEFLYQHWPGVSAADAGDGTLVAFGYRLITVLIALIGAVIYLTSRREMSEVMHEAEEVADAESGT